MVPVKMYKTAGDAHRRPIDGRLRTFALEAAAWLVAKFNRFNGARLQNELATTKHCPQNGIALVRKQRVGEVGEKLRKELRFTDISFQNFGMFQQFEDEVTCTLLCWAQMVI